LRLHKNSDPEEIASRRLRHAEKEYPEKTVGKIFAGVPVKKVPFRQLRRRGYTSEREGSAQRF
jgi:hypothetical protein